MSKVKNITGEDRFVPWLGRLVLAGQVVEVPEVDVYAYTQQESAWEPADEEARVVHAAHSPEPAEPADEAPARSASKADWVEWVAAAGRADRDDLEALTRADIIDRYAPPAE